MTIILVEVGILLALWIARKLLKNKISFFLREGGGYTVRRDSYRQDGQLVLIEDVVYWRHPEKNRRYVRVDKTNIVYSMVMLDKRVNTLLVYGFCIPLLSMLKGSDTELRRALVLGGGGGSVPLYILRNFTETRTDIVEISEKSIETCKKHFLSEYAGDENRVRFYQDDAANAVNKLTETYQFVFCDLYLGGNVAEMVYDWSFLQKAAALTDPNGFLVINGSGFSTAGAACVVAMLKRSFAHVWLMYVHGHGFVPIASNKEWKALDRILAEPSPTFLPVYPSVFTDAELKVISERLSGEAEKQ